MLYKDRAFVALNDHTWSDASKNLKGNVPEDKTDVRKKKKIKNNRVTQSWTVPWNTFWNPKTNINISKVHNFYLWESQEKTVPWEKESRSTSDWDKAAPCLEKGQQSSNRNERG